MKKQMIAPIVIVVILVAYNALVASLFFIRPEFISGHKIGIIFISLLSLVALALIFVLVQRIREIQRGEEDDLGQY